MIAGPRHILTGEYPPMPGGVADYTRIVAVGLAAAGEAVTVWTPAGCDGSVVDAGVEVRRLPDHFGRAGRATMDAGIPAGSRVLVQYVPHAFGAKSMNVPLAGWLWRRRRRWAIDVMFHEVAMPFGVGQPLHHNIPAAAHRMMARLLVSAADRVFVSTSAWNRLIRPRRREPIVCPVFSNVTPPRDPVAARDRMRRELGLADDAMLLGHFGACLMIEHLAAAVESAMSHGSSARFIFIGGGSTGAGEAVRRRMPAGRERVIVTGGLALERVSEYLVACDLVVQPYPDGVTTRRSSAMAALACDRALLTTRGALTEGLWAESKAAALSAAGSAPEFGAAVRRLMGVPVERARLAAAGCELYRQRFDGVHTIAALRQASGER